MERMFQIDILKSAAIVCVILLHVLPAPYLYAVGAPFYIWQAVPVFIVIMGFNVAGSYGRADAMSLDECYAPGTLYARIQRLMFPYIMIWALQMVWLSILNGRHDSAMHVLKSFVLGGSGSGGYFVPVIMFITLVVPFLYWISIRSLPLLLVIAFVANVLFEMFSAGAGMSPGLYRVLGVRYLFASALGVWLCRVGFDSKKGRWLAIGALASGIYIAAMDYGSLTLPFIHYSWKSQNVGGFAYAAAIVWLGLRYLPSAADGIGGCAIRNISAATWHIFLVQKIFFLSPIYSWMDGLCVSGAGDGGARGGHAILSALSVLICCAAGYAFYLSEKKIRFVGKRILQRRSPDRVIRSNVLCHEGTR